MVVVEVKHEQQQQQPFVADDDVAIVSSSAPSESVGRRSCGGRRNVVAAGGVGRTVVLGDDDGQSLPRYPTIQFAGPSTATAASTTTNSRSSGGGASTKPDVSVIRSGTGVVANPGESGSFGGHAQQVIAKATSTAKRKRETGELGREREKCLGNCFFGDYLDRIKGSGYRRFLMRKTGIVKF